tara:strand:- start:703 stop:858 length:156 start_codon:yes stop_codon:yes gene_type:complete
VSVSFINKKAPVRMLFEFFIIMPGTIFPPTEMEPYLNNLPKEVIELCPIHK